MKILQLAGRRYTKLTVLSQLDVRNGKRIWLCQCDCGNKVEVAGSDLQRGHKKSCGCYKREENANRLTKHGMKRTKFYGVWCGIKSRCNNKNHEYYHIYGGRGIKVCDRWQDFMNFYSDMIEGYSEGLTVERLNVNGDYSPENCVWATNKEQGNNKRSNRVFTIDGVTDTLMNLCERYEMNYGTVKSRLRYGWDIERSLKTKVAK